MPQVSIGFNNNQLQRTLFGIACAGIFGLLATLVAISFFAVPAADDFCNAERYFKYGLWGAQADLYMNWGGRYASNAALVAFTALGNLLAIYPLVGLLTHVATFFALLLLVHEIFQNIVSLTQKLLIAGIASILLFAGAPDPAQTYYWLSGALTYQLGNISFLLLIALLVRLERRLATSKPFLITFSFATLCTLTTVGSNETSMLLTLLILSVGTATSFWLHRRSRFVWIALGTIAFLGSAAAILAPGNFARMGALESMGMMRPALWGAAMLYLPWVALRTAYWMSHAGLWASAALLFATTHAHIRPLLFPNGAFDKRWLMLPLAWALGLLALNLLGFVVNRYPLPERAESVVYLLFLLGWFPTSLIFGHYFFQHSNYHWPQTVKGLVLAILTVSIAGAPNMFEVYKDTYRGYRYAQEMRERFHAIEKSRNAADQDIVVGSISRPPRTLFATEISTDPANFRNACMARYFGVHSIRLGHTN